MHAEENFRGVITQSPSPPNFFQSVYLARPKGFPTVFKRPKSANAFCELCERKKSVDGSVVFKYTALPQDLL